MDVHKIAAISLVATAPSPATSGTSLVVTAGEGARFPTGNFDVIIWPAGANIRWGAGTGTGGNFEICRASISTDTMTLTRAQYGTTARTVVVGDQIAQVMLPNDLTGTDARAFTFSTTTTDADPGDGKMRFNNATYASATSIFIDTLDAAGVTLTNWYAALDAACPFLLKVWSAADPSATVWFLVTDLTSATGYYKMTVTYLGGNGSLTTTTNDTIIQVAPRTSSTTVEVFTSGSNTSYTAKTGAKVLCIQVIGGGGGGGGGASGTNAAARVGGTGGGGGAFLETWVQAAWLSSPAYTVGQATAAQAGGGTGGANGSPGLDGNLSSFKVSGSNALTAYGGGGGKGGPNSAAAGPGGSGGGIGGVGQTGTGTATLRGGYPVSNATAGSAVGIGGGGAPSQPSNTAANILLTHAENGGGAGGGTLATAGNNAQGGSSLRGGAGGGAGGNGGSTQNAGAAGGACGTWGGADPDGTGGNAGGSAGNGGSFAGGSHGVLCGGGGGGGGGSTSSATNGGNGGDGGAPGGGGGGGGGTVSGGTAVGGSGGGGARGEVRVFTFF